MKKEKIMIILLLLFITSASTLAMEEQSKSNSIQGISFNDAKEIIFLNWIKQVYPTLKDIINCTVEIEEKSESISFQTESSSRSLSFSLTNVLLPEDIIGSGMYELEKMIKANRLTQDQLTLLLLMSQAKVEGKSMHWNEEGIKLFDTLPEPIRQAAEFDRSIYDLESRNTKEKQENSKGKCSVL